MTLIYILLLVFLLVLNAFFVLAEFAAVKVRSTEIDVMQEKRKSEALILRHIHSNLDEYLSVCQLGITFASIGLGFVGEPAVARLLEPVIGNKGGAHAIAIAISYIVISYLHIFLGEQLPKVLAIRYAAPTALLTARLLLWSRRVLYLPLIVLNGSVKFILRRIGLDDVTSEAAPSEAEVRVILERSQQEGVLSFRRLLLLENVFDFGHIRVKDEMRSFEQSVVLYADRPWEENRDKILATNHTRFPVLEGNPPRALGILHIKDLLHSSQSWPDPVDLRAIARKTYLTTPDMPLEQLLTELRRRRIHMALVQNNLGQLTGLITMEDVLEQLVGAIEDEFEKEAPLRLGDVLKESRVILELKSMTAFAAIEEVINACVTDEVSLPKSTITESVIARERSLSTYLGEGLAVPHARLEDLKAPYLFFARSTEGVVFDSKKPEEKAKVLFLLLTPGSTPRLQTRLLARIANLRESSYVWDRLLEARSPAEALEAIRSGDELITR